MSAMLDHLRSYFKHLGQTTFSSLGIRNYRLYYIGQIISSSGTFMQSVAQAWLVLKLTNSGTALGIVMALQYVPILFLGPFGGVIADRYPKRRILFITQTVAGLLAVILGVLVATGLVTLWMVYLLAFCLGLNTVLDNPTRQTFYYELVGADNLRNAITLYSTVINLARIIGPAIAGALIASVGLAPCFIVNGVSYVAVVIMLAAMRPNELYITPPAPRAKGQLMEGLKYVISTPILAATLVMMGIIGMLTFEFSTSLPMIAEYTFKGDASSYAFLTSSMGVGAAMGGLFFASRKGITSKKLVSAALYFGLAVLAAAVMPNLLLTGLAMVVVGIFTINFSSLGNSALQLESTPQMRGRVMSFWSVAWVGSTTLGAPLIGWVGEAAGARWALGIGGISAMAAAAIGVFMLRKMRPSSLVNTGTEADQLSPK
jgi:MFS family permease